MTKNKLAQEFTALSNRLQEIEAPYIGKISLSLNNAIGIFPFAMAAGFLVCSYLASQLIRASCSCIECMKKNSPENLTEKFIHCGLSR